MKVFLLSRFGRLGASSRVRSYQYLPFLRRNGVDVTVAPLLADKYLSSFYYGKVNHLRARVQPYFRRIIQLLKSNHFDLLWIEHEIFPWLPAWIEALFACSGIQYIDYDDAYFHRYDLHSNRLIRTILGGKIDVIMRLAAQVIVGNEYLAERARSVGAKRVVYVPTVVDLEKYRVKRNVEDGVFVIGWIGTPLTAHYLDFVRTVLSELCKNKSSHVVIVGGGGSFDLEEDWVTTRPWSEDSEVSEIQHFDVGIMPLPDEPWEWGKCGYKLIQYMACGKPVVASPVGVNSKIIEHGINGFLAGSKEEWFETLTILRDDPKLRKEMGQAGRKRVEREYCLQVTGPRLLDIFRSISNGTG